MELTAKARSASQWVECVFPHPPKAVELVMLRRQSLLSEALHRRAWGVVIEQCSQRGSAMLVTRTRRWTCLPESLTHYVSVDNVPLQAFSAGEMNVVMRDLSEPMYSKLDIRWSVLG